MYLYEYLRKKEDHKISKPPRTEIHVPSCLFMLYHQVGIAGPVGQSFGVIEKNWICPKCGNSNFATGNYCHICREKKPLGGGGLMMDTAMVRDQV